MSLPGTMVRILPQYNHLHVAQFGVAKGVKYIFLRWINCLAGLPFSRNGTEGINKIGLLLLFCQHVMPG
ncbi:Uncharacterised protein [Enterobacter cloacae]|nr:Uncharacterised protein [Enterobacter cloacae]